MNRRIYKPKYMDGDSTTPDKEKKKRAERPDTAAPKEPTEERERGRDKDKEPKTRSRARSIWGRRKDKA